MHTLDDSRLSPDRVTSPFDLIRRFDADGHEYWSARDLMRMLGYSCWREFRTAIDGARTACRTCGLNVDYHFCQQEGLGRAVGPNWLDTEKVKPR